MLFPPSKVKHNCTAASQQHVTRETGMAYFACVLRVGASYSCRVCVQERKAVSKQGLTIKRLLGSEVSTETWDKVRQLSACQSRLRHQPCAHCSSLLPCIPAA
jgi:predicted N-acyltransferase